MNASALLASLCSPSLCSRPTYVQSVYLYNTLAKYYLHYLQARSQTRQKRSYAWHAKPASLCGRVFRAPYFLRVKSAQMRKHTYLRCRPYTSPTQKRRHDVPVHAAKESREGAQVAASGCCRRRRR